MHIHVAVIEWESSTDPSVFLGLTYADVARAALDDIRDAAELSVGELIADDPDYFEHADKHPERHKASSDMTEIELREWHADFREATTVPWVTFDIETVLGA